MNEEKAWELGQDLDASDVLLDSITFGELILTIHCNHRKEEITPATVVSELRSIIEIKMEDMWFLVQRNADKIVEYAIKGCQDD